MKWPLDYEAHRRKVHDFWNVAWGFFLGCLACAILSMIVRNF